MLLEDILAKRKNKKGMERLNLIPIMDAVFIFIFFLLMSAQFIKIYEIGSDAPVVTTVTNKDKKKDPLNLTLQIHEGKIVVLTGVQGNTLKTISNLSDEEYDFSTLYSTLLTLKKKHADENSVILKPIDGVRYEKIVDIMDAVRKIKKEHPTIVSKSRTGETIKTRKLFDQIIFETII